MKGVVEAIMYGFVTIDKVVVPFIGKTITEMLPKIEKCEAEECVVEESV